MAEQVEEIKAKTDIVSTIGEHVELKKAGRNYKALCPFHSEKTPSFVVSPELQIFKCFGCDSGGDVFTFLQEHEGMDFPEALKFLAERAGVKLKPRSAGQESYKEKLYQINTLASRFYTYVLLRHSAGKAALNYLIKTRGLKLKTIKNFHLGYSPDKPFAAKSFLVDKKKIKIADLERAGVVYVKNGRPLDRFRGRVIFPLFDHRGNIAGFAGRTLPLEKSAKFAKYINTPETEIYHKSKMLYGLNIVKSIIRKKREAVVVEGELDMISSWQVGIKNVVGIKGSALTQDQVKLLSRHTDKLVLALDADTAGDTAARRGIEIAEKEGFDIRVASLNEFKDPDEMARKDPKGLALSIKNAQGVWDYIIDSVFSKSRAMDGRAKARISKEIVPVLASIGDKIVQAHYVNEVARRLKIPVEAVANQVSGVRIRDEKKAPNVEITAKDKEKGRRDLLEERLLAIAFRFDPSVLAKRRVYSLVTTPLAKRILDTYRQFAKKDSEFDPSEFASHLPSELASGFTNMILVDVKGDLGSSEEHGGEIRLLLKELKIIDTKDKLRIVAGRISDFEQKGDTKKLQKAKREFEELTKLLTRFEGEDFKGIIL